MTKWAIGIFAVAMLFGATPGPQAEKEILATMEAYKQAFMKKDAAALAGILSDDLIYTHSSAQHQNKAEVLDALKNKTVIEAMDFRDARIRVYDKTAVVACDIDSRSNNAGVVTTTKLHVMHVLVKGPQGWQVVARQATRPPDAAAGKK